MMWRWAERIRRFPQITPLDVQMYGLNRPRSTMALNPPHAAQGFPFYAPMTRSPLAFAPTANATS